MDSEETEQMKSYQVFVGGGTNLDLSESAIAAVDRYKESAGPRAAAAASQIPLLTWQESATTAPVHTAVPVNTTLSPQEVIFVH